jgi:hypothetical protein
MSEDQRQRLRRVARNDESSAVSVSVLEPRPGQTTIMAVVFTGGSQREQLRAAAAWLDEHATVLSMRTTTSIEDEMVLTMFVDDGVYRP